MPAKHIGPKKTGRGASRPRATFSPCRLSESTCQGKIWFRPAQPLRSDDRGLSLEHAFARTKLDPGDSEALRAANLSGEPPARCRGPISSALYAVGYNTGHVLGSLVKKPKTSMASAHPPKPMNISPAWLGSLIRKFVRGAEMEAEMVVGMDTCDTVGANYRLRPKVYVPRITFGALLHAHGPAASPARRKPADRRGSRLIPQAESGEGERRRMQAGISRRRGIPHVFPILAHLPHLIGGECCDQPTNHDEIYPRRECRNAQHPRRRDEPCSKGDIDPFLPPPENR